MEVLKITDNPDGSATLDLEINNEEQKLLIQYAVTNLIKEYIERNKKNDIEELIKEKGE